MSSNVPVTAVCTDQHLQRSAHGMYLSLEWEVIPAGLLPCWGTPSLPLRALWVPYCGEQALLALPAGVAQLGLDCRSMEVDPGFDAHKIFFPITSLL